MHNPTARPPYEQFGELREASQGTLAKVAAGLGPQTGPSAVAIVASLGLTVSGIASLWNRPWLALTAMAMLFVIGLTSAVLSHKQHGKTNEQQENPPPQPRDE